MIIYIYVDNKTYVSNSFLALILSRDWPFSVVNNPIFVVHVDKLCPKHGLLRSLFLYGHPLIRSRIALYRNMLRPWS